MNIGDEVRVFDVNARRNQSEGNPGTIVKIGRVLVTISYGRTEQTFRLDTGRSNDAYGHQWFLTMDEAEAQQRQHEAVERLREYRVELGRGHSLSLDQIEALVAVLDMSA